MINLRRTVSRPFTSDLAGSHPRSQVFPLPLLDLSPNPSSRFIVSVPLHRTLSTLLPFLFHRYVLYQHYVAGIAYAYTRRASLATLFFPETRIFAASSFGARRETRGNKSMWIRPGRRRNSRFREDSRIGKPR
ncbi:hypothetical protein ACS0PU_002962 [Formica fusca]